MSSDFFKDVVGKELENAVWSVKSSKTARELEQVDIVGGGYPRHQDQPK